MANIEIPKGYKLCVQCHQKEDGSLTHLIFSKITGEKLKYFLFKVVDGNNLKQISTSQTPVKLYQMIWL